MSRILALVRKDLKIYLADRKALMITFLVPIGIASFFGMIFGGGGGDANKPAKKIPVLVVDNDHSPLTAHIIEGLGKSSLTEPKVVSEAEADKAVKSGDSLAAIVFPAGFGKAAPQAMFAGDQPEVELRYDPSKSIEMQAIQGSIMQVGMAEISKEAFSPKADYTAQLAQIESAPGMSGTQKQDFRQLFADLKKVNAYGGTSQTEGTAGARQPFKLKVAAQTAASGADAERKSTLAHTFAGMAVQGVLFFGIEAAMALLRDRRLGIWKRLRASPVTLGQLLTGKGISSAIMAVLVLAGVLAFGMAMFGIRATGSFIGLLAVLLATAIMVSAFGLLVASLGRTEQQSRGFSVLAVLLMTMLGGAWFPSFLMPEWVQKVSFAVPVRWSLDGFDAVLWRGQGLGAVLMPVAGLLGFALVFGVIAAWRFRTIPESA